MQLERREAGSAGWSWLKSRLVGGPLSSEFIQARRMPTGRLYAYVPPGKHLEREQDFEESLGLPSPTAGSARLVHAAAADALSTGGDFVVLETWVPRKVFRLGTVWNGLATSEDNVSFHRNWVLPWWPVDGANSESLRDLVGEREAAFVIVGRQLAPRPVEELSATRLAELASATEALLVSAFDGESFIVWVAS
jgi:hypothetical protein